MLGCPYIAMVQYHKTFPQMPFSVFSNSQQQFSRMSFTNAIVQDKHTHTKKMISCGLHRFFRPSSTPCNLWSHEYRDNLVQIHRVEESNKFALSLPTTTTTKNEIDPIFVVQVLTAFISFIQREKK